MEHSLTIADNLQLSKVLQWNSVTDIGRNLTFTRKETKGLTFDSISFSKTTIFFYQMVCTLLTTKIQEIYLEKTWKKHPTAQQGVTVETEGTLPKRALFHHKKFKKGTPDLTSHYVHRLFTFFLIKQIFEKNKSSRAASGSLTQF